MKTHKKYWIVVFLLSSIIRFSSAQNPTIKVGVYYSTAAAANSTTVFQARLSNQIQEVRDLISIINKNNIMKKIMMWYFFLTN